MQMILDARGRAELARTTSREKRVRHWRRFRAIELLADGNRPETVAEALGCSRASVYVWAKAWREQGIEGLREAPHPGKQRSLDDRATRLLVQLLEEGDPQERGYHATGWTVPLLRAELERAGYWVSERTIRRTLHRLGFRWKRPKYVLGRPDPDHERKKGRLFVE
jgi:putative transposase